MSLGFSCERPRVDAVIQCAMDMEAAPFLEALTPAPGEDEVLEVIAGDPQRHAQRFSLGSLAGRTVLVVTSGIGLANAAAATARALTLVDAPIVIAGGTTGGLHENIRVGDIAVGVSSIYNDADATVFGYELGQIPRMPVDYHSTAAAAARLDGVEEASGHRVMVGRIVSGDSFASADVVPGIRARFPDAMATDMETVAMAQTCYGVGVDWISLRAVSDLCGEGADESFHMEGERAARHSFDAAVAYLSR